jgi:uncharacterized protein YndB with AHSA1/START domain
MMPAAADDEGSPREPGLTLVRRLKAPPAAVYAAWTDPALIARWWGPDAGPVLSAEADVRPGGRLSVVFRTLDGGEHNSLGVYREVVENEKLVLSWRWASAPEEESLLTVLLRPVEGGTELTLIHERFVDEAARDGHREGWGGALDKLVALLS